MDTKRNVLILCGGKWVGMVLQLREAMRKVPALRDGILIVADKCESTPAGYFADASVVVPPIGHPDYVERLLDVCLTHSVRVVVPLIDLDLERLAPYTDKFAALGSSVVCPSADLVDLCLDKQRFALFAEDEGLPFPRTYGLADLENADYPLFYKPRRGYGSRHTGLCRSQLEAQKALSEYGDLIFQEYITAEEVSVDGFISVTGKPLVCVPRVRDKVVGGEAYQSHTIQSTPVHSLALRTMEALARRGLRGPLNIQMFLREEPCLIEVNTRLGSASVLSNLACEGRLLTAVLTEACGDVADGNPHEYHSDIRLYRYLGDVFYCGSKAIKVLPSEGRQS